MEAYAWNRRWPSTGLVISICAAMLGAGAPAQGAEPPAVVFLMESARHTLRPLEPLVLDIRLENRSLVTYLRSNLEPLSSGLPVHIVMPDGARVECVPAFYWDGPSDPKEFGPGDVFATRAVFVPVGPSADGSLRPLLLEAGKYAIEVGCMLYKPGREGGSQIQLKAELQEVAVAEPSETEAKALALWRDAVKKAGYILERTGNGNEAAETLREKYGATIYGLYARYYEALAPDRQLWKEDPLAHHAAAAEALEAFLPVALAAKFPLTDEVLVSLVDNYCMTNNRAAAREAVEELHRRFPESPALHRLQELPHIPDELRPFGSGEPPPVG